MKVMLVGLIYYVTLVVYIIDIAFWAFDSILGGSGRMWRLWRSYLKRGELSTWLLT